MFDKNRSPASMALFATIAVMFVVIAGAVFGVQSSVAGKNKVMSLGLALPARTEAKGFLLGGENGAIIGSTALLVWIGLALIVFGVAYAVQGWVRSRPSDDDLMTPRDIESAPPAAQPQQPMGYPPQPGYPMPGMQQYPPNMMGG